MGTLTKGLGTPQAAAASSLNFGLASLGLGAAGDIASGIGQSQQYNYMAQVARNNAAITRSNASSDLAAAGYAESVAKTQAGRALAATTAEQGASGVDINIGSPVDVRNATATVSAMDAAVMHYNATRAMLAAGQSASNYETQAALDEMAAKNSKTAGYTKAATSLIGGAASLSNRWSQYKNSGAL